MGNEPKFTRGPWERNGYGHVTGPNGRSVLFTGCTLTTGNHPGEREAEANTDLIAAAPDLFAALSEIVRVLDALGGPPSSRLIAARAALEKALGSVRRAEGGR